MQELFGPSKAVGVPDESSKTRLVVEGLTSEELWLTSIRGDIEPNYQIMYSLGAEVFLNSFQPKLSIFQIKGVYIFEVCGSKSDGEPEFMTFYRANNIGVADSPLRITFNTIVITGYLVKLMIGEFSQGAIEGHSFELQFLGMLDGDMAGGSGFKRKSASTFSGIGSLGGAGFQGSFSGQQIPRWM